jgi:hypothetical protein
MALTSAIEHLPPTPRHDDLQLTLSSKFAAEWLGARQHSHLAIRGAPFARATPTTGRSAAFTNQSVI